MNKIKLDKIEDAIKSINNGEIIIVVDDENGENEGDFITAAETINSDKINFMAEGEKLIPINIEDEMKSAYIDYSMSVIVSRALPDVRDGLKPVHRRVLFGMYELGVLSNRAYKKISKNCWRSFR